MIYHFIEPNVLIKYNLWIMNITDKVLISNSTPCVNKCLFFLFHKKIKYITFKSHVRNNICSFKVLFGIY